MTFPFTILHPIVDACSVTVLVAGGFTWERTLVYNALAFALQFPLGIVLDAHPRLMHRSFALSILLTLSGVAACACGVGGWLPLVAASIGNALFHLCAGKSVLDISDGKSGPIGLFISTGALGLFAGMKLASDYAIMCCLGFGIPLAVLGFTACMKDGFAVSSPVSLPVRGLTGGLVLGGLFVLVVWRSWSGMLAGGMTSAAGIAFACMGAAVTWLGKAVGGYLGDFCGKRKTVVASIVGSTVLCFMCTPEQPVVWLVLLFISQLATGPVLSFMYERAGRAGGSAFGLNCLGLFAGGV